MVWPAASDCSTGSLSASAKCQPSVAPLLVSLFDSVTVGSIVKVPMFVAPSVNPGRCADEADDLNTALAVWVSIRSRSWIASVPPVVSVGVAASSVTAPAAAPASLVIVGVSFVPVIVTVTSWVTVPP